MQIATGLSGRALFERAAELVGMPRRLTNGHAGNGHANGHDDKAAKLKRDVDFILRECVDLAGTKGEIYLGSRGLLLPQNRADLLFRADLTDYEARRHRPGIVAIVRDPVSGAPTGGIHRTYLAEDGSAKADTSKPKMMLGPCIGGVVMLAAMAEGGGLGIAEGIETSLAATRLFNIPTWAALNDGGLGNFAFPAGLKWLTIFADRGDGGEKNAAKLYHRAVAAGINARVILPRSDDDFAEDLRLDLWRPDEQPEAVVPTAQQEIIPPASKTLDDLLRSARELRCSDEGIAKQVVDLMRECAINELDPIATEQFLAVIKQQTKLSIGALRDMLKQCRREVGAESHAVAVGLRPTLQIGSDVEISQRVAEALHREYGKVIFADGDFWRYSPGFWEPIEHQAMRLAVHRFNGAVYPTPAEGEAVVQLSKGRIDSVLHEMRAKLGEPDFFVDTPPGINCASGFISFASDGKPRLLPHDPEHRCRHALPGEWNSATLDPETPPADSLLGRLLNGVFKGDVDAVDKRQLLAEVAGAAALGYGPKLRQPKAIVLKGEEAENGKSQILDAIRALLPPSAVASISATKFGDERFIVHLRGKLLNASDELSIGGIATDVFKTVITGNMVCGRDVYRSMVEFRPAAQHIFAANRLPEFTGGMDRGVRRRLLPLCFNRVIPIAERVEDIGLRIGREEPDLLLAFAVAGAARLLRQRAFTIPPSSDAALKQWIYRDNTVLAWVEARVDPAEPPKVGQKTVTGIKSRFVHSQYRDWARAEGFAEKSILDLNGFLQALRENKTVPGITIRHTKSGNWLVGLSIRATDRNPADDGIEDAGAGIALNPSGWER